MFGLEYITQTMISRIATSAVPTNVTERAEARSLALSLSLSASSAR
jgi:hypothetical protein